MDTARGLQEVVSHNVRVLMAVHDITSQKDLVARLGEGWDAPKLNRSLHGSRRWALEDLPALATAFRVTPGALLGDTAELVGAIDPVGTVSRTVNADYHRANHATILPFPQVSPSPTRYLTEPARVITLGRARPNRTVPTVTDISIAGVTSVTSVVGS